MPIIATPGQQSQSGQPQDQSATLPPRLQSAFTPTNVQMSAPVTPPPQAPVPDTKAPVVDEFALDDDEEDDNDDFGHTTSPAPSQGQKTGTSLSRMSEEDRRKAITAAFSLVLGRAPADRDYSYYRFSTLTEEGLVKSLLNLPEHKKLVEKATEHTSLKQSVSELDLQVKQLTESMNSMKQELITMQQLLVEKNRYIQQMRGIPESNMQPAVEIPIPQLPQQLPQQAQQIQVQQAPREQVPLVETKKLPGPFDELKSIVKGVFSGRR